MTLLRPGPPDLRRPLRRRSDEPGRSGRPERSGRSQLAPRTTAVPLRLRSTIMLALVSLIGVATFGWPLLAGPDAPLAGSADAPYLFGLLVVLLIGVVLAEVADGALDAKAVAVLGVLTAAGSALRMLSTGVTGFSPMFVVLVLGGRVFGRGFGFVLGALTMFTSALVTGGVGPWLPFQMLGAAWVGFGAGCLPRTGGRVELGLLAAYSALSGIAYGFLLNLWFWPFVSGSSTSISYSADASLQENLASFLAFCLATSLGFDVPRAIGNAVIILVAGATLLQILRRTARKAAFDTVGRFEPAVGRPSPTAGEVH